MRPFIIFILFLTALNSYSQFEISHYTKSNGLPHDITYGLFQDQTGYLWIGTDDGLVKFNGYTFKVYTTDQGLTSNFVIDALEYEPGKLLVATWGGGLQFFENDTILQKTITGPTHSKVNSIVPLKNNYFVSGSGESVFNLEELHYQSLQDIIGNAPNETGQLKYVSPHTYVYGGRPFYKSPISGLSIVSKEDQLIEVNKKFSDIFIDDVGSFSDTLHYVIADNKRYILDARNTIVDSLEFDFNQKHLRKFYKKNDIELLLVETQNRNFFHIFSRNPNTGTLINLTQGFNLPEQVSDILIDQANNIWISTYGNGVYKLSPKTINKLKNKLVEENVIDILSLGEHLGVLTNNKLFLADESSLLDSVVTGSYNKSMKLNPTLSRMYCTNFIEYPKALKFNQYSLQVINKNYFTKNSFEFFFTKNILKIHQDNTLKAEFNFSTLDINEINDVLLRNDELWIAHARGIKVLDFESLLLTGEISEKIEMNLNGINSFYEINDKIYLVSGSGIHQLLEKEGKENKFRNILKGKVNDLVIDRFGVLWVATQNGITVVDGENNYYFNTSNGISSTFINTIHSHNHQIIAGGNKGYTVIDNASRFRPYPPPKLIVNQEGANFELDMIDFSEIDTQIQFSLDDDWQELNNSRIDFSDSNFGEYSIQFRARNLLSNWHYSDHLEFSIEKPWYYTVPGIILLCLISSLLLSLGIYYQLKKVKQRAESLQIAIDTNKKLRAELDSVRQNVARDFHDELGNKLAGIKMNSSLMINDSEEKKRETLVLLKQIKMDADALFEGVKDFVWSIDHKSDRLQELIIYLSDFGENLYEFRGIQFIVDYDSNCKKVTLPYFWSRQLLLIFKEAMTNALKHSSAKEVRLIIDCSSKLKIELRDDGVGFNFDELSRTNGLLNMKERAHRIGAKLIIESNEKGTTILFKGKINEL